MALAASIGLTLLLAGQAPVGAQATRTWISGVGDDANPCSRTAPCKTFAGAISKTAEAGEINITDPGGFGAVTITKSISLIGEGATAGILAAGTNGILVNADPTDIVVIRGLDIEGQGVGLNGIRYLAGGALHVENTTINGFRSGTGRGIDVQVTAGGELYVQDVIVRNNAGAGIFLKSTNSNAPIKAVINGSQLENNDIGLDARDNSQVTIRDSVVSGNTGAGIQAIQDTGGTTSDMNIESTTTASNTTGIRSGNGTGTSTIRIANVTVYSNVNGLSTAGGSQIVSFGNNMIFGNNSDGSPTGTVPLR